MNIDKVDTASVDLEGSQDLGGIEPGGYSSFNYSITNQSTKPAYVFVKIQMNTTGLYEVVDTDWCRVTEAEQPGEIILAYGTSAEMAPVAIREEVVLKWSPTLRSRCGKVRTAYR